MLTHSQLLKIQTSMIQAAKSAGSILKKNFRENLTINKKTDAGLVTQIDVKAEKAVIKILKSKHKNFDIYAEESGDQRKDRFDGTFVIDPLDGTTNYIHGFPMFCVSIGAIWKDQLVCGVIYHPLFDDLYAAVKGCGSYLNGKRIFVSKTNKIENSLLSTGFAYAQKKALHQEMKAFECLSLKVRALRRPGSAALDLAYTAQGVFDGFWERNLSAWDMAAGALLVEEAGGKVTLFGGQKFNLEKRQIIASNGKIHKKLIESLAPSKNS